jgi:hypothetical protein
MRHRTAFGTTNATGIGTNTDYGSCMKKPREWPELWVAVCGHVKLPVEASLDRVRAAYGDVVGRGTFQRIQAGGQPQMASLAKMAEQLRIKPEALIAGPGPRRPPKTFADRHEVTESDWALLQDIKTAAFESEIKAIRERARELDRMVELRIEKLKGQM